MTIVGFWRCCDDNVPEGSSMWSFIFLCYDVMICLHSPLFMDLVTQLSDLWALPELNYIA